MFSIWYRDYDNDGNPLDFPNPIGEKRENFICIFSGDIFGSLMLSVSGKLYLIRNGYWYHLTAHKEMEV